MTPYLSIVVASRNDDHGGDLMKRMEVFMRGLIHQTNKFKLDAELIIVEWNPDPTRQSLSELLPKPKDGDFLTIKYITVPNKIHKNFRFGDKMPLYQMIAKNVGIRRASAEYVLSTNIDLIFSDRLMEILAQKKLAQNFFYRANRCDIPQSFDDNINIEDLLLFAQKNIIRRLGQGSYKYLYNYPPIFHKPFMLPSITNKLVERVRRFYVPAAEFELLHLDTMACGDFTLMHRNMWFALKGYAELDLYSIHIDSLCLVAAKALGYEQVVFAAEACTYHIDHYNGWESMTPVEKVSFINQRPGIGWDVVRNAGIYLVENKAELGFNDNNWGFANEQFEEIVFNKFE